MIKIEAQSLEDAYKEATVHFGCSLTEVAVEVVQYPSRGFLGLFKKPAIVIASKKESPKQDLPDKTDISQETVQQDRSKQQESQDQTPTTAAMPDRADAGHGYFTDGVSPVSFVSGQDDDLDDDLNDDLDELYLTPQDDEPDDAIDYGHIVSTVKEQINNLFSKICFDIEPVEVRMYNEDTLLVEFNGEDAALLIGKEGYRYKALSYMIFNWINSKYQLQLRLEIAEFLTNQEDAVSRYLSGICETIDKQGHAQTKILDGVLIQIALKQLRLGYPDKYVSVRTTRDNLKFIIINDYHSQY